MISKKLSDALNNQVNREIYSAYLYLSMASYFDSIGLSGSSNWMKVQFREEMVHAMKLYDYLYKRQSRAVMLSVEAPPVDFQSALSAFEFTLEHEKKVTGLINNLSSLAESEKDSDAADFLKWFIKEQKEEEESAKDKVLKFKSVGGDVNKIKEIDTELAKRKFLS